MSAHTLKNNKITKPQSLLEFWPALAGLSAVFLFEMLDTSILNVALPTIGRDISASVSSLQWITSSYAVVFGGLMLAFGAIADRFGRRKMMLIGLIILGLASLSTIFVQTPAELITVRVVMGIAAAMTTPGTMALAFRMFEDDKVRVKALTLITTVGLVGLASGPIVGGFLLSVVPWQSLLLINVPIAILALLGIRAGIKPEGKDELHQVPIDIAGAALGTLSIVSAIIIPTLFVENGAGSASPWLATTAAVVFVTSFIIRERTAKHPLIDMSLLEQPLVASGLAYKAATALAITGLGYMISLQLQLYWGWSPLVASIALLPQVATLLLAGLFVGKLINRIGFHKAAWLGSLSVLAGIVLYAVLGQTSYIWVAITLVLISVGLRMVNVVAGMNVMKGAPKNRTSMGSALVDTTDQITSGISIAIVGTFIAAFFVGDFTQGHWNAVQMTQFHNAASLSAWILALVVACLAVWAYSRTRKGEGKLS